MSIENVEVYIMAASSIDITKRGITGKCDLKCAYNFKYPTSNSTLTNKGIYLALTYDATTMAPVTYNAQPYNVSQIHIYSPSLHLFNGSTVAGELIILHSPQKGGDNLYVAIPLINSAGASTSTPIIQEIIDKAATSAPAEGDSVALNISGFTLNDLIPSRLPFISYTGNNVNNEMMSPWIVYGQDAGIKITSDDADKLAKIISPFAFGLTGEKLYLNEAGANSVPDDQTGDIYISCEPTNTSEEEVTVTTTSKNPTVFNWGDAFKNPIWKTVGQLALFVCIILLVFFGVSKLWGYGTGASSAITTTVKEKISGGSSSSAATKHVHFGRNRIKTF